MREVKDIIVELQNTIDADIQEIKNRIAGLQQQITDMDNQINAFKICFIEEYANRLKKFLTKKLRNMQNENESLTLVFGENYNKIEFGAWLDDWQIIDEDGNIVYAYNGPGWDKNPRIKKFMTKWEIANDYLTRPLNTGASYGLMPYKHSLEDSIHILNENLEKMEELKELYDDFMKEL